MKRKKVWRLGATFLALVVTLVVAPGVWAQSKFRTLYTFTGGADGSTPVAGLIFDPAGNLYGTTYGGGAYNAGTVFKLTPSSDGSWTQSVLYSFCSLTKCSDGAFLLGGLILDAAGNLYGTSYSGGAQGAGIVFKLTPTSGGSWQESVLYSFCSVANCGDGNNPSAGLITDLAGNLYGTTIYGGINGAGVVFELTPKAIGGSTENVLHSFCSTTNCADGGSPLAGLVFDQAGNLYGTTVAWGAHNWGTVFELMRKSDGSWKEKVLHDFTGNADGGSPSANLIFDQTGNLYGTTESGGDPHRCSGAVCGVVFQLTPNADGRWKEKVLHHFRGGADGSSPVAGLIFDPAGNLFGTTSTGGSRSHCFSGCGVVFKLAPNSKGGWNETLPHYFVDNPGAAPFASLIVDAAGNFYGTTQGDNNTTFGSVFEIMP